MHHALRNGDGLILRLRWHKRVTRARAAIQLQVFGEEKMQLTMNAAT